MRDEFMNKTAATAIKNATGLNIKANVKRIKLSPPTPGTYDGSWSIYCVSVKAQSGGNTFYPETGSCTTLEDAVERTVANLQKQILEFETISLKTGKEIEDFFGEALKNRDIFENGERSGVERITPTKIRLLDAIGGLLTRTSDNKETLRKVNAIKLEDLREMAKETNDR